MEEAKRLRRTIRRLAEEVDKHHDRISVNGMLDLSAQIKRSSAGIFFDYVFVHPIYIVIKNITLIASNIHPNCIHPFITHYLCFDTHPLYALLYPVQLKKEAGFLSITFIPVLVMLSTCCTPPILQLLFLQLKHQFLLTSLPNALRISQVGFYFISTRLEPLVGSKCFTLHLSTITLACQEMVLS